SKPNAWAEIASMVAGFIVGFLSSVENPIYSLVIDDFGIRLMVTAGIPLLMWAPVMLLTKPESDEKLDAFYTRVRPGGPGWRRQRERTGIAPAQDLASDIQRVFAGVLILLDRKSTRLNSSHVKTSYAVFGLKKTT